MTKLLSGDREVEIKTDTERLLLAALKAIIFQHGHVGGLKSTMREFEMGRFAFKDAHDRWHGDVQIATDGNNGRDVVRLIRATTRCRERGESS